MFRIFDRYIGKTILNTTFLVLFMLTALSSIIRFIEQLRRVNDNYTFLSATYYTLLLVPKDIELFFPIAALLGALIALGMLASKSELVVMEAAGFSRFRIIKAVLKTAIPLVLLTMAIGEWVAPYCEQYARNMYSEKMYGGTLIATKNSIWAKDGTSFVHIGSIDSSANLHDITIYTLAANKLIRLMHAQAAHYADNSWQLTEVNTSDLSNLNQIKGSNQLHSRWNSTITPDKLGLFALDPQSLSATGLYYYITYLKNSDQDATNYQLLFWKKIFTPFSVAVMMLLALSFIFGPLRSVPMGLRILTGIVFGFLFYISDTLISQLSIVVGFSPFIAALVTSLLFLLFSFYLLNKKG